MIEREWGSPESANRKRPSRNSLLDGRTSGFHCACCNRQLAKKALIAQDDRFRCPFCENVVDRTYICQTTSKPKVTYPFLHRLICGRATYFESPKH